MLLAYVLSRSTPVCGSWTRQVSSTALREVRATSVQDEAVLDKWDGVVSRLSSSNVSSDRSQQQRMVLTGNARLSSRWCLPDWEEGLHLLWAINHLSIVLFYDAPPCAPLPAATNSSRHCGGHALSARPMIVLGLRTVNLTPDLRPHSRSRLHSGQISSVHY